MNTFAKCAFYRSSQSNKQKAISSGIHFLDALSIVQTTAFFSVTYNEIRFQQPFCGRLEGNLFFLVCKPVA